MLAAAGSAEARELWDRMIAAWQSEQKELVHAEWP
jgi:hypothetical protein